MRDDNGVRERDTKEYVIPAVQIEWKLFEAKKRHEELEAEVRGGFHSIRRAILIRTALISVGLFLLMALVFWLKGAMTAEVKTTLREHKHKDLVTVRESETLSERLRLLEDIVKMLIQKKDER